MEKYKTCRHSTGNIGQTVVYVKTGCPRATIIKGVLVSSRERCRKCGKWEGEDDKRCWGSAEYEMLQ